VIPWINLPIETPFLKRSEEVALCVPRLCRGAEVAESLEDSKNKYRSMDEILLEDMWLFTTVRLKE
jgi:hypothetical protein